VQYLADYTSGACVAGALRHQIDSQGIGGCAALLALTQRYATGHNMVIGFCSHEQQSQNWVRPIQAVFVIAYVCRMLSRTNLTEFVTLICLQEVRDLTSDQPSHGHVCLEVSILINVQH